MNINGKRYLLTRHGRRRFQQRINFAASDREIIETAVAGLKHFTFVWGEDHKKENTMRLITVLYAPTHPRFKIGKGQQS